MIKQSVTVTCDKCGCPLNDGNYSQITIQSHQNEELNSMVLADCVLKKPITLELCKDCVSSVLDYIKRNL